MWYAYMPERKAKAYVRKATKLGLKARCFDEKFDRSPQYRYKFIKANPPVDGKYRCVYCGRLVNKNDMEVDHILPVSKAKSVKWVRKKLKRGVNDLSNLVPACHKCNRKKHDSTFIFWRIRARLGSHVEYWGIRLILLLVIVIFIIAYISTIDLSEIDAKINYYINQFWH